MKKVGLSVLGVFSLIVIVALVKGVTHYTDQQYHPKSYITPIVFNEQKAINRLAKAIRIPTVSYDDPENFEPASFNSMASMLVDEFPNIHTAAERTKINDYSLVYKFKGSDPSLKPALFMGHMDVVSVDEITLDKWTHPPFSGTVENGMIYGRGAIDDKSTVMALMEAMEHHLTEGHTLKRTIYFAFGHDEEVGGKQGAKRIAEYFEQSGTKFEFVLDEGGVILKPGMMPNISQEVAIIGVAEKGFMNIRLVVEQDGGHSSTPPEHTGAGIIAQAIVKLENAPFPADLSFTNLTFDKLGSYADFGARVVMSNQWLTAPIVKHVLLSNSKTAASIRTTTAATMLSASSKSNVLPTQSTAVVNFRIMPNHSIDEIKSYVEQVIDDPKVKLEVFMANNASPVSTTEALGYKLLEQTIREFDKNVLVAPYMVQGGTDAKYFYRVSDSIYRFMRVKVDNELLSGMHGIDERIPTDDYIKGIQLFHELIYKTAVVPALG
ncbi:M20 family peptidase [Thalassotalea atypica]|uniref:M20 family peptidase n=1 Tax=Thalassotalea atypica TaxID=2054316 RepID=UPI0025725F65|nr:M20 family peptidase [Thalassotalea atypica]